MAHLQAPPPATGNSLLNFVAPSERSEVPCLSSPRKWRFRTITSGVSTYGTWHTFPDFTVQVFYLCIYLHRALASCTWLVIVPTSKAVGWRHAEERAHAHDRTVTCQRSIVVYAVGSRRSSPAWSRRRNLRATSRRARTRGSVPRKWKRNSRTSSAASSRRWTRTSSHRPEGWLRPIPCRVCQRWCQEQGPRGVCRSDEGYRMVVTHPIRLGTVLNFSVFQLVALQDLDEA